MGLATKSRTCLIVAALPWVGIACGGVAEAGHPVRLAFGRSDTLVVNHTSQTLLPVTAVDANDQKVANAGIRFEHVSGSSIGLTSDGKVDCSSSADATIRATLNNTSHTFVVRCRPVIRLQIPGPIQFVIGDSALSAPIAIPLGAYDEQMRAVALIAGTLSVRDSSIATVTDSLIRPRKRGVTPLSARVGNQSATVGVHIYQRLDSRDPLDTLLRIDSNHRQLALPLTLQPGDVIRHKLPPGDWMITTLMYSARDSSVFQLRFEEMNCTGNVLNDRNRFACHPRNEGAAIVVSRARGTGSAPLVSGYLLLRWLAE